MKGAEGDYEDASSTSKDISTTAENDKSQPAVNIGPTSSVTLPTTPNTSNHTPSSNPFPAQQLHYQQPQQLQQPPPNIFPPPPNVTVTVPSNSKKRALCARACSACRKAHKACENERPCRRCVARGNGPTCLAEATAMGYNINSNTKQRRLVPILKKRRIDTFPIIPFGPPKPPQLQTVKPAPSFPTKSLSPVNTSPPTLPSSQTIFPDPDPRPSSPLTQLVKPSPNEDVKTLAKNIMTKLLSEIRHLNETTTSLKEEQQQVRLQLSRLRAKDAKMLDDLARTSEIFGSQDPFASLDSNAFRDQMSSFFAEFSGAQIPRIYDEFSFFERPGRFKPPRFSASTPATHEDSLGTPNIPFAVDDATKPFIIVKCTGQSPDMPCIAVSETFCKLLGFAREEILSGNQSKVIYPDPALFKEGEALMGSFLQRRPGMSESGVIFLRMKYWTSGDTVLTARVTVQVFYGEDGWPSWIVGCIHRIDSRSSLVLEEPLSPDRISTPSPEPVPRRQEEPTLQQLHQASSDPPPTRPVNFLEQPYDYPDTMQQDPYPPTQFFDPQSQQLPHHTTTTTTTATTTTTTPAYLFDLLHASPDDFVDMEVDPSSNHNTRN